MPTDADNLTRWFRDITPDDVVRLTGPDGEVLAVVTVDRVQWPRVRLIVQAPSEIVIRAGKA